MTLHKGLLSAKSKQKPILSLHHVLDQEVLANPSPSYQQLRTEDLVHWPLFARLGSRAVHRRNKGVSVLLRTMHTYARAIDCSRVGVHCLCCTCRKGISYNMLYTQRKKAPYITTVDEAKTSRTTQIYGIKNTRSSPPISHQEQIKQYVDWLKVQAVEHSTRHTQEKRQAYAAEAIQPVSIEGQEITTFAPFQRSLSALQTMTPKQNIVLRILGLLYVIGLVLFSTVGLQILIAAITLFYVGDLLLYLVLSIWVIGQSNAEQIDDRQLSALSEAEWPYYTILCPLYHEANIVPQFVQAMKALDYPSQKLQILFLTETDDTATRDAIEALHLPTHFSIVTVPDGHPRTKPRACNYGLLEAHGDYVVIYDAEDVPDPLQLKKAILTFANHGPETGCVQAKLNFYNTEQNILTRWFTAEYSSWFDVTLPGLQRLGVPLPLGGTSNHFKTDQLRKVGAWDAFNVTEDCDLGLRLGRYDLKTVVVNSTTYEEANSQVKNWMRQRSRWIKGYMQTYLVHMRHPLDYLRSRGWRQFLSLQLVVGGKTAVLLINPLMWLLVATYILFHTTVEKAYHVLYPMPILYMGTLCLIFGNFCYAYIHLIGCMKREEYRLVKWTLLIPVYWAMASGAAYIALYQLIFMPHYWEKTLHGLHLRKTGVATLTAEEIEMTRAGMQEKQAHTSRVLPAMPRSKTTTPLELVKSEV